VRLFEGVRSEPIIGLYRTGVIHRLGSWRGMDQVEFATLDWVDWFNNRRLFEPIGDIPPVEFEGLYYEQKKVPAMVAALT